MGKLPKDLIRKYGISKKAWAVYRGGKKTKTRGKNMGKKKSYRRSSGRGGKLLGLSTKGLLGLGTVGVISAAFLADEVAKMVPVEVPFKAEAVAYAMGGPAGVAAKVAKDFLMPKMGGGSGGVSPYGG